MLLNSWITNITSFTPSYKATNSAFKLDYIILLCIFNCQENYAPRTYSIINISDMILLGLLASQHDSNIKPSCLVLSTFLITCSNSWNAGGLHHHSLSLVLELHWQYWVLSVLPCITTSKLQTKTLFGPQQKIVTIL